MALPILAGIYKITSPSKRVYIGQSKNIRSRLVGYKSLNFSKHQRKLYSSFIKYGVHNHLFEIIHESYCPDERNKLEEYYVILFNCLSQKHGLNCREGGQYAPISEEARLRISKAKKGKSYGVGRKLSEETKRKISIANKGKKRSIESIKPITDIHRKKLSNLLKGNKYWVGRKHKPESIAKQTLYHSNRVVSDEWKQNISKAAIGRPCENSRNFILNLETGIYYNGYKEAADTIGITADNLLHRMKYKPKTKPYSCPFMSVSSRFGRGQQGL